MARRLRIQYPGAIYHVLNRGNYKSDVFEDPGAATAFVSTLEEAVDRYGWRLGAYVVMRNHYHLAVQTPEPNLAAGMHWLQATFATRFNRLRSEMGHVFQGRYKAILLETNDDWARVVNYIHLNPVRAGIVPVEHVAQFRWSSLNRFHKNMKFNGLTSLGWLQSLQLQDRPQDWERYDALLREKIDRSPESLDREHDELTTKWAIGSDEWKAKTLLTKLPDQASSKDQEGLQIPAELVKLKWKLRLQQEVAEAGKTDVDIQSDRKSSAWKVEIAERMQREVGATVPWLANELKMGKPASVRSYLWKRRNN